MPVAAHVARTDGNIVADQIWPWLHTDHFPQQGQHHLPFATLFTGTHDGTTSHNVGHVHLQHLQGLLPLGGPLASADGSAVAHIIQSNVAQWHAIQEHQGLSPPFCIRESDHDRAAAKCVGLNARIHHLIQRADCIVPTTALLMRFDRREVVEDVRPSPRFRHPRALRPIHAWLQRVMPHGGLKAPCAHERASRAKVDHAKSLLHKCRRSLLSFFVGISVVASIFSKQDHPLDTQSATRNGMQQRLVVMPCINWKAWLARGPVMLRNHCQAAVSKPTLGLVATWQTASQTGQAARSIKPASLHIENGFRNSSAALGRKLLTLQTTSISWWCQK